jgi:hypothetical protein
LIDDVMVRLLQFGAAGLGERRGCGVDRGQGSA